MELVVSENNHNLFLSCIKPADNLKCTIVHNFIKKRYAVNKITLYAYGCIACLCSWAQVLCDRWRRAGAGRPCRCGVARRRRVRHGPDRGGGVSELYGGSTEWLQIHGDRHLGRQQRHPELSRPQRFGGLTDPRPHLGACLVRCLAEPGSHGVSQASFAQTVCMRQHLVWLPESFQPGQ